MKKILSLLSAVLLIISFSACSQNKTNITAEPSDDPSVSATDNESSTQSENESKNQDTVNQNASAIVYFSATGTTKTVAETMSSVLNADLYEIVPAQPYSSDDLNYNNDSCRANLEMNDEDARPEIAMQSTSDTRFGGARRRKSFTLFWKAMIYPAKQFISSAHQAAAVWNKA